MKRGTQRAVYHYDARGSIDSLTDATPGSSTVGKAVQRYGYEPYGRLTSATIGTLDQPFRWNSEYAINDYDYKIGARWYDASLARWTQRDPSGQDPNPYAYANNDPVNNTDPSGLSSCGDSAFGGFVDCVANPTSATPEDAISSFAGGVVGPASTAAGCFAGAKAGAPAGAYAGTAAAVATGDTGALAIPAGTVAGAAAGCAAGAFIPNLAFP